MQPQRDTPWTLILIAAAVVAALAGWYFWQPAPQPAAEVPVSTAVPGLDDAPAGPQHPLPEPGDDSDIERELVPLPALSDSDQYFKLELSTLFGPALADALISSALIERLVATIDSLTRAQLAERIRPMSALPGQLEVAGQDGSGDYLLLSDNYARYDALVEQVTTANLDEVMDLYRRYYPLFQKAYVGLGYPNGYFNDRLVEVIDHLLATPEVSDPIVLVRPHVLYEFADEELESLSSGQKMLIRIGPQHRAAIKETLIRFRTLVTSSTESL